MVNTVLLLRHGEKSGDSKSLDLSDVGRNRAEKLASFLPRKFGAPDFIFSAAPTGSSVRSYLTVRPLGDTLKMRLDGSYKARDFFALATKLLFDPAFVGKMAVICWTHSELPALAGSLNVRSRDFPEAWDELVFNQVFELNYKASHRPKVKKVAQPF
ncbi:MAG: hypothetical protein ABI607_11070 [Betaproteobacteria bacterium]